MSLSISPRMTHSSTSGLSGKLVCQIAEQGNTFEPSCTYQQGAGELQGTNH